VEHQLLTEVVAMVESCYVNGAPPHMLPSAREINYNPGGLSCIYVTDWTDFKVLSPSQIQEIFRHRHILVLNAPVETVMFDREGLETLGSLHASRHVQGLILHKSSVSCVCLLCHVLVAELRAGTGPATHRPGTLEQLRIAVEDEEHPRILNMLDLPMGHLSQEPPPKYRQAHFVFVLSIIHGKCFDSSFASHEVAWQETRGQVGLVQQEPPVDTFSWGAAATDAATTWIHMDDEGFGAVITVKAGAKWWAVMKPRRDARPGDSLGNLRSWKAYPQSWKTPESGMGVFGAEAVLLRAGSVLYV
jgi:hypothetical protein